MGDGLTRDYCMRLAKYSSIGRWAKGLILVVSWWIDEEWELEKEITEKKYYSGLCIENEKKVVHAKLENKKESLCHPFTFKANF